MTDHRLVIGPGGSGRTHALRRWAERDAADLNVAWVTGSPLRPPGEAAFVNALSPDPDILIIDDLQWCEDDGLQLVLDRLSTISVWASRRPWPMSSTLRLFDDLLTEIRTADRLASLDVEDAAGLIAARQGRAVNGELVDTLHEATAGAPGFLDDAVASGWLGDLDAVGESLIDAVVRRVERSGPEAMHLARVLAVDPELDMANAARALPDDVDADHAQRAIRAGGLVDAEGQLIALVRAAVLGDLTALDRERIHDRLAEVLGVRHPDRADEHLLAGSASTPEAARALIASATRLRAADPARALDLLRQAEAIAQDPAAVATVRAEALFHLGSPEAAAQLELVGAAANDRTLLVSYGLDMRDLRWSQAADRALAGDVGAMLGVLAEIGQGLLPDRSEFDVEAATTEGEEYEFDEAAGSTIASTSPMLELVERLVVGTAQLAEGQVAPALGALALASDDHDRLRPDLPLGVTPHFLAALASILSGDLLAADDLLGLAIDNGTGGPGEASSHVLLLAYVRLLDGKYPDALEAVRTGESENWQQRDRFLLAALDAALARRSGDTARLREAWRRADPVLVRQSPSWLLLDPFTELLAAGLRLGHHQRVEPLVDALVTQGQGLPAEGPASVGVAWLQLQLALAAEDLSANGAELESRAERLASLRANDRRSLARIDAGRAWAAVARRQVDESDVVAVAQQLAAVGEPWEASRLVGQAALDCEDSQGARRLLEQARQFVAEPGDQEGGDALVALGLSEREADVARLVAEGRTHKEIGSQLYISPKTVEHHVAKIRQKLGATSRAELLATVREAAG